MEEKLLEKEYDIPYEIFGEAYKEFQKKYVLPRSYILMGIFLLIGVCYIYSAVKDPDNTLAYILVVACFCMAGINWYNPRRIRRSLMEGIRGIENERYKLSLYDTYLEIATVSVPQDSETAENDEEKELFGDEPEEIIESSKLYFNNGLRVIEKEDFFMTYQMKEMFYVIPKKNFTQEETDIFRNKVCAE